MSWTKARAHCANSSRGTDLVVINDEMENRFLQKHIASHFNNFDFWIGLTENGNTKQYAWVDGASFEYGSELGNKPWMENEPNTVKILE